MLVVFRSQAAADVLMLSAHARMVLQAAGKVEGAHDLPERGVFTVEQLPAAIAALECASQSSTAPPGFDSEPGEADSARDANAPAQAVTLRQRAWPLLDMLRKAQRKGQAVLWEPAPAW